MSVAKPDDGVVVLGARQAAVGLFLMVVLMGTFGGLTYIVGRMVMPSPAAAVAPAPAPEESEEQVLFVSAVTEKKTEAAEPAPSKPVIDPAPDARPWKPASGPHFREPAPGELFLQVAAVDRGVAEVFVEYLARREIVAQYASGPDERSYRVLVGPISTNAQLQQLRERLEADGFQPFVRRYQEAARTGVTDSGD